MSTQLSQITKKAKLDRKVRFTSLAHLLTPEFLKETWGKMNRRGAGGVDGKSAGQFGSELEMQVETICEQLKKGALPRTAGPKSRNTQRAGQNRDETAGNSNGRGPIASAGGSTRSGGRV